MEDYASRTAYGQRVVYGVLGVMACFGDWDSPADHRISKVTADFHRPMFLNVDYRIEKSGSANSQTIRLFDGTVLVLTLAIVHEHMGSYQRFGHAQPGWFERNEARELFPADIQLNLELSGRYAADSSKLEELCRRWNVTANSFVVEALLWSSYFIGMDFPGRHALFFRLSLNFSQESTPHHPFQYHGVVSSLNKAIEQTKIQIALSSDGSQLASGLLTAFVRPKLDPFNFQHLQQSLPEGSLKGKVALIIGASRGLGAALAVSMASAGAHVVAFSRSPIALSAALPAHIRQNIALESGDSTNVESVSALQKMVVERFGKLDFLICNAFPPIPALRLETNTLARIQGYLRQSTDLVLVPLCAFLPLLNESRGCAVIISSSAVEKPVREWPHYVAAKSAIESFGVVAPLQYPNIGTLIVRPERLLTDMTNTPMGRQDAMPPLMFARQITEKLQFPPVAGTAEIFRGSEKEVANHQLQSSLSR